MKRSLSRQFKQSTEIIDSFAAPGLHTLSMGAGVQSTALLIKFGTKYDHVIFSDTGDEQPATYQHIETNLKPYCKENNIDWITVHNNKWDSLSDYCIKTKWTPSVGTLKRHRACTSYFKIDPYASQVQRTGRHFR